MKSHFSKFVATRAGRFLQHLFLAIFLFGSVIGSAPANLRGGSSFNAAYESTVQHSAIPYINIASGTISAAGALSGITALLTTYSGGACIWLPANAVATVAAANWYWAVFSSTTAATVYLNTCPTTTVATVPTSLTPVTDGKGAYTAPITEVFGPSIAIPAGMLGTKGEIAITALWSANPANGNVKSAFARFSGSGGTAVLSDSISSQLSRQDGIFIQNRDSAALQVVTSIANTGGYGQNGGTANGFLTVDTTVATSVSFSMTKATATDNIVLERYRVAVNVFP
jgi:hypothetical protein